MTELISTAAVRGAIDYFDKPASERAKLYGTAVFEAHFAVLRQFAKQTLAYEDAKTKPLQPQRLGLAYEDAKTKPLRLKRLSFVSASGTRHDFQDVEVIPGFRQSEGFLSDPNAKPPGAEYGFHVPVGPVCDLLITHRHNGLTAYHSKNALVLLAETDRIIAEYDPDLHNCPEGMKYRFTLKSPYSG